MVISNRRLLERNVHWKNIDHVPSKDYHCGYCGSYVASREGWILASGDPFDDGDIEGRILVCPHCKNPTWHAPGGEQVPAPRPGRTVRHLPSQVEGLYDEARAAVGAHAYTAAVMVCRGLLHRVAADCGLEAKGASYQRAVDFLIENGYVAAKSKEVVDHVRKVGNDANHKIMLADRSDAVRMLNLVEHMLITIYEHPEDVASAESD